MMRPLTSTMDERVEKGAALLDEQLPGWFLQIRLHNLHLENGCSCILGQLACDIVPRNAWYARWKRTHDLPLYSEAVRVLRLTHRQQANNGFIVGPPQRQEDGDAVTFKHESWDDLTKAWRKLIRKRLRAQ